MHAFLRAVCVSLLAFGVASCSAGKQFNPPQPGQLQLGATTPNDLIAIAGEPYARSAATLSSSQQSQPPRSVFDSAKAPGSYERLTYAYVDTSGQQLIGRFAGVVPRRALIANFFNGKLGSYLEVSSFKDDTTDFDTSKISSLQRDKSTRRDVIALFGPPNGAGTYPFISRPDGIAIVYAFSETNVTTREVRTKTLAIYLDANDVVRDFESNSAVNPLATAPASTTTTVPIFIPRGK